MTPTPEETKAELLNCPHCGSAARLIETNYVSPGSGTIYDAQIECCSCECTTPLCQASSPEEARAEAVGIWNTRANVKPRFELEANDDSLPRDVMRFAIGLPNFKAGERIGWWYREDEEFLRADGLPHPRLDPPYSGIVVPRPDLEMGVKIQAEDAVIVMDCYPVEKCYCEATYIAYRQLIDVDELGGVVSLSKTRTESAELARLRETVIPVLKLAYAQGHYCDNALEGKKCPGCEAGYALEAITGRKWTQEECEL